VVFYPEPVFQGGWIPSRPDSHVTALMLRQFAGQLTSAPSAAVLLLLTSNASRGVIDSVRPVNQGLRWITGGARCMAAWKADLAAVNVLCTRCTGGDSLSGGNVSAVLQMQYISRGSRECVIVLGAWQHQHVMLCGNSCCGRVGKRTVATAE
jgi:hypothetical protein